MRLQTVRVFSVHIDHSSCHKKYVCQHFPDQHDTAGELICSKYDNPRWRVSLRTGLDVEIRHQCQQDQQKIAEKLFVGYMNYFDKKISARSGHNITKLLAFLIELSIILYNMGNWRTGDTLAESRRRFTDVLTHYEAFL